MITVFALLFFFGFYALYLVSYRANYQVSSVLALWMKKHPALSKWTGCFFLILAFVLYPFFSGILAGICIAFVALMMIASFIIILSPLKFINFKTVTVIFSVAALLEIFV